MNYALLILLGITVAIMPAAAYAEQSGDVTIGTVVMRNTAKLDGKARAAVAAAAAKIKKKRAAGVIKVRGDFPGATSAEEYLTKSVFMAREVEHYLRTLLPAKFQVFVTASGYSGSSKSGDNAVAIILYPHQLRLEEMESLRFVSTQANPVQTAPGKEPVTETDTAAGPETVAAPEMLPETTLLPEPAGGGMLSVAGDEAGSADIVTKKERDRRDAEDALAAEELVRKAKARAAERAKRNAAEN